MEAWLSRITDYLLAQSWQIAVITILVAIVSFLLRNRSAHVRYLIWLLVLAKCLVPPLHSVPFAVLPQEQPIAFVEGSPIAERTFDASRIERDIVTEPAKSTSVQAPMEPPPKTTKRPITYNIRVWLAIGWLVGAVALLFYNLLNALRTQIWLQRQRTTLPKKFRHNVENFFSTHGMKHIPNVWLINGMNQPFVWGLVRGSIYLPADLLNFQDSKSWASLLGHELSHVIRFDAIVHTLQIFAQVVFWFHPFVWWANRKIRAEREKCCDEMAIVSLHALPEDYSEAIVEVLAVKYESIRPVPSLAVAGPVKNIEERIRTMLRPGKKFYKHPSLIAAITVLLVAFLTVPTAVVLTAQAGTEGTTEREEKPNTLGKLEYVDHLTRDDLYSVSTIETSPDGRYAYAAAYNACTLVAFKRDRETGYLEHIQTISDQNDLSGAVAARLSPDGRYVVCTSFRSNTVSLLERESSTGLLKKVDTFRQNERGGQGLSWVVDAVFSPDSKFVYTVADHGQGAAVSVLRITDRRKLELIQTNVGEDKCFAGARGIAISPKGDFLYVPSYQASALVVLDRDAKSGKANVRQIVKDEEGDVHGLACAFSVTCSPDGKFVYTNAGRWQGDNAICVFKKMSDGTLSLVQEIWGGEGSSTGLVGGNELIVSPDGQNLYALGSRSNSVVSFKRNTETGELTYLQAFYDSEVAGKDGSASGIEISPDGEYVYVAGEFDYSILMFKRLTPAKKGPVEALHRAASSGDIDLVKSLIASGADVNKKAERGYTPLHWAVKENRKDAAKLLISAGANVNARTGSGGWTTLHIAVRQGNKDMTEWLISKAADLNAGNQNNELTPLLVAGMSGKTDLAELLISKGANVSTRDNELKTPLHYAARDGYPDVVELLLKKGADVNAKTNWGGTALHYASMYGHISVAQLLIEKGADVRGETKYGWTPLLYAARAGNKDMMELLVSKGADVNTKIGQGYTPLYFAIVRGDKDIAALLIAKGADVNARNQYGTPIHLAATNGLKDVVELLIAKGADVNAKNNNGQTPLHLSARQGRRDTAELLINKGAEVNAKNKWDRTPLDIAVDQGHEEIVELLRKHGPKNNEDLME